MIRLARPALLLAATAALGACTTLGDYGYGGVSVGVSSGGYYPYRYSPYSYYGWYDGYYYPGAGYYIYDSYGRRHRWSDRHRHYWEGRRDGRRDRGENWDGYRRDRDGRYHDGRDGHRGDYSRDRDGDRGEWQRRGDRDGRGNWQRRGDDNNRGGWQRRGDGDERGNWQRRSDGDNRGDRGNWQRGGNRDGDTFAARRTSPPAARQQPHRSAERARPAVREGRDGRITVDRGREGRRDNED
jgi:hypothetical protein